uniref:RNA-directed DNA polymerase n=1 Tax=Meloidogyne hapla TaxID=6305 RepID=A0A1I8B3U1_MELHA
MSGLNVKGLTATGMLDGGAQISLISSNFLLKMLKDKEIELKNIGFSRTKAKFSDVNGQKLECHGIVELEVKRENLNEVKTCFHITDAPFGYDLLFGTNSLGSLGFKLMDIPNNSLIDFGNVNRDQNMNTARVIYKTRIQALSVKNIEVSIGKEWEGKEIVLHSENQRKESAIKVEPSIGKAESGKNFARIFNSSCVPIELEENEVIGNSFEHCQNAIEFSSSMKVKESWRHTNVKLSAKIDELNKYIKQNTGNLSEKENSALKELIIDFEEIFALDDKELTQTNLIEHQIETANAQPVKTRCRPIPYAYREKVALMIQDYLERGIIRGSNSPWASPIVIVPKKDGSLRFCVDFRGVNSVTIKDSYPLPNIDNILLTLGGKKFFSCLDFLSGYWQIKMEPQSIEKTAFITEFGLHEFLVLPFGLCNAVATFQRFMNKLFEDVVNKFVFIYIDDILIASESWEEHIEHLKIIFKRISEAGLKLKIAKCKFACTEIPFLGHILTREGIKKDAEKTKAVVNCPIPKTRKQLSSLLGFLSYYRKFIHGFSTLASPLFKLLRKDNDFKIGETEKTAIELLKEKLLENAILYFPDFKEAINNPKRRFIMLTDASKIGIAAILCQTDKEGNVRPIFFASRQCNKHEAKYCATELEALAIRFGSKKFFQFIAQIPTRVLTDHRALVSMFKSKKETGNTRVDKWLLELNSRFTLQVEYNPGKQNIVADFLSRAPTWDESKIKEIDPPEEEEIAFVGQLTQIDIEEKEIEKREEWVEKTKESEFSLLYEFLEKRNWPDETKERQKVINWCSDFTIIEGLLYKYENDGKIRLFVPEPFRNKLLSESHSGKCAGHLSGRKIFKQLAVKYYWPNMQSECINSALKCRICAHSRNPKSNEPPMKIVRTSEPFELICLDILDVGPSNANSRYIFVAVDHFSKYVIAVPIPDKSAESIAKALVENVILIYGAPKRIHSDRGKEFLNSIIKEITNTLKIEQTVTAGYDPNANGLVERINQIIIGMLKRSTASNWTWPERLPYLIFAYNSTPSETTGFSPYNLILGKPPNLPFEEMTLSVNPLYTIDDETYIQLFRENLLQLIDKAKENSEKAQEKSKKWYDSQPKVTANKFKIGERVMVIFPGKNRNAPHKKLLWNHFGPYKILEMNESSATLTPVDKSTEKIKVPLERLIRVPPGVPDVATLPRGKNPFKNILMSILLAGIEQIENKNKQIELGIKEKNLGQEKSQKVFLLNASFSDENMELGTEELAWTKCSSNENLKVGDLDPVLNKETGIGARSINTAMKTLLATFLLRTNEIKATSAARNILNKILDTIPGTELIKYVEERGDTVKSGLFPNEQQIESSLSIWFEYCQEARKTLEATKFEKIRMTIPEVVERMNEAEKRGWQNVFKIANKKLEKIRAITIHKAKQLIHHQRVFVGDSSANQLSKIFNPSYFLGKEGGSLNEVIRKFNEAVLSSEVQVVVVMVGRDALLGGETVDQVIEEARRLKQLLERFNQIHVIWLPPPYVRQKHTEYEELLPRLIYLFNEEESDKFEFITTTTTGRSFLELTRFGNSFNGLMVEADGKLKQNGIEAMKAWLVTQVPGFPGDHELGVRNVRSQVVVPVNRRREERTFRGRDYSRGRGLGDRTRSSRGQMERNFRGRGLGDRTPRRSVFERIYRSPYRYDRSRSRRDVSRSRERT